MRLPVSSSQTWPWPDSLDALIAAPAHHALLFENDAVRVLETRIPPGELVPVHTHRWPSVLYVLSWSAFVRRDAAGTVLVDSRLVDPTGALPSVSGRNLCHPTRSKMLGPGRSVW
jgi:hypothetical protein